MAFQFKNFRATRPVVRLRNPDARIYEVFFIVYDPAGHRHNMRYSKGINSRPPSDRIHEARAMADVLWEALSKGWNPLVNKFPKFEKEIPFAQNLTLPSALSYAADIKRKTLSKYSMYDYDGCVRFMTAAARKCQLDQTLITSIKKPDIRNLIAQAKEDNNWSNKARNKYLTILRALLGVMEEQDILDYNPAGKIKMEREEETIGYRRLTDHEKELVAAHLLLHAPAFFDYLMFIYDDGVRRTETLQIKVGDINLVRDEIRIRADVAKTNKERIIPITPTIREVLMNREIWKLPADQYLFSSNGFLPGPVPYHPNTPTSWWKRLVQNPVDAGGLGIDCKMYSLKHKGADDKIEAGIDLDVLKTLYGHRSTQMTEIYARAIREKYKKKIIDNAPAFAKIVGMHKKVN